MVEGSGEVEVLTVVVTGVVSPEDPERRLVSLRVGFTRTDGETDLGDSKRHPRSARWTISPEGCRASSEWSCCETHW